MDLTTNIAIAVIGFTVATIIATLGIDLVWDSIHPPLFMENELAWRIVSFLLGILVIASGAFISLGIINNIIF